MNVLERRVHALERQAGEDICRPSRALAAKILEQYGSSPTEEEIQEFLRSWEREIRENPNGPEELSPALRAKLDEHYGIARFGDESGTHEPDRGPTT